MPRLLYSPAYGFLRAGALQNWMFAAAVVALSNAPSGMALAKCIPPPNFVDAPPPQIEALGELASHTEEIVIARPLPSVLKVVFSMSLSDTIDATSEVPGVVDTYMLTKQTEFGEPGSRRLVCLSDGSNLAEQSLVRNQTPREYRFQYIAWNYTSKVARPIQYGVGEFLYTAIDAQHTKVHWTYSFGLHRNRLPGSLGALGRFVFRVGFLDRQYAEMMRGVLKKYKLRAERQE